MLGIFKSIFGNKEESFINETASEEIKEREAPQLEYEQDEDNESYIENLIKRAETESDEDENSNPPKLVELAPNESRLLKNSLNKEKPKFEYKGLLFCKEITGFLTQNYFSRGRHNGVNFGDEGTLNSGILIITSEFEMILSRMIESRNSKLNDMERMIDSVPPQFEHLSKELAGKHSMVMKEIDTLNDQINLAKEEKGWVSPALNNYKTGFMQGKQLAINYKF